MNLHKIINRIKEKKASKRFDVEIPEFNVKDCLKEEGIKIRVKNSEEKYLDVIFKVSTKFSSDPDGYGEDLESFAASFSYTAKNGYTFEKKADTFKEDKENYGFDSNLQANKIKRLLSKMARNDRITMTKPAASSDKNEIIESKGGIFNDIVKKCSAGLSRRLDALQRQAESEHTRHNRQEEQIKRNMINDAFMGRYR